MRLYRYLIAEDGRKRRGPSSATLLREEEVSDHGQIGEPPLVKVCSSSIDFCWIAAGSGA